MFPLFGRQATWFVVYSDSELKLHSDISALALTDCLWAIIDATHHSRRRYPLRWRINFDQFPRLTINRLFALYARLKGVSDSSPSSGAYFTAIYFIMQVKASEGRNWDKSLPKETSSRKRRLRLARFEYCTGWYFRQNNGWAYWLQWNSFSLLNDLLGISKHESFIHNCPGTFL